MAVLAGCGEELAVTDYTSASKEDYLLACADPLEDPSLVSDVCRCVYDQVEGEYSFDEFAQLDVALRNDQLAPLPDNVIEAMSDCFLSESGLDDN